MALGMTIRGGGAECYRPPYAPYAPFNTPMGCGYSLGLGADTLRGNPTYYRNEQIVPGVASTASGTPYVSIPYHTDAWGVTEEAKRFCPAGYQYSHRVRGPNDAWLSGNWNLVCIQKSLDPNASLGQQISDRISAPNVPPPEAIVRVPVPAAPQTREQMENWTPEEMEALWAGQVAAANEQTRRNLVERSPDRQFDQGAADILHGVNNAALDTGGAITDLFKSGGDGWTYLALGAGALVLVLVLAKR